MMLNFSDGQSLHLMLPVQKIQSSQAMPAMDHGNHSMAMPAAVSATAPATTEHKHDQ